MRQETHNPHADGKGHAIPRDAAWDSSLDLWREGYGFISHHCARQSSDIFRTRLMLYPVICMQGAEAARLFYSEGLFTRVGAMPWLTLRLLQDKGSIALLDDAAHRHRKRMFLAFLGGAARIQPLIDGFRKEWLKAAAGWELRRQVTLFDEVNMILTRAVLSWAGIPDEVDRPVQMCQALADMVANAGRIGPKAWLAVVRRGKVERQLRRLVEGLRDATFSVAENSPVHVIATHRDLQGQLLAPDIVAVEILNVLRPTVAIGRYIVFCALALERHPDIREAVKSGDERLLAPFVEEVRRFYPFFPFIGGRARKGFRWRNYSIPAGSWVLLDLFGTNRDPRRYDAPLAFRPGQAPSWQAFDFDFIPQGGGDPHHTHRCPGERATVALMMEATRLLSQSISYEVPPQDLSIDLRQIPTRPRSGLLLRNVRVMV